MFVPGSITGNVSDFVSLAAVAEPITSSTDARVNSVVARKWRHSALNARDMDVTAGLKPLLTNPSSKAPERIFVDLILVRRASVAWDPGPVATHH